MEFRGHPATRSGDPATCSGAPAPLPDGNVPAGTVARRWSRQVPGKAEHIDGVTKTVTLQNQGKAGAIVTLQA